MPLNFPSGLQLGGWASGEAVSLGVKGSEGDERDVLKRRVHELHVQNEKLLDLVAEERLVKQGLEKDLQLAREQAQHLQAGAPATPSLSGGPLAGVFSFATVLSPPIGAPAPTAASEEAKLENDMMRTKLETLRSAYEALQQEKDGEKQAADEDVKVLQEQVRSLKRALKQMQEGKDISEAADELMKVPDPPPPPQPPESERAMEVAMLREQLETLQKAYRELEVLKQKATNSDSEDEGDMGLRGIEEFGSLSAVKLGNELQQLRLVEAALRQSVSEADARASKLEAQVAEEESGRRNAEAKVTQLQAELEETTARSAEFQARSMEMSSQLEKLESLGVDAAAKASVIELTAEVEQLRASQADLEEQRREAAEKAADEIEQLGEALQKAEQEVEALKLTLKEEEAKGRYLREELDSSKEQFAELQRSSEAGHAEHAAVLEELESQVKALKAELHAEQEKSRVAELAHSESRASISAAADLRIAELVAELEKVKVSSFAEVQAREQELKQLSEQLQREVQSLRSDLERTEDSKRGLQRRLRECGDNKATNGIVQTGSFLSVSAMEPMGPEGIMYMLKIEELEAENARLSEQVHGASALYIPKIQELESDVRDATQTLQDAWESQQALQEDVALKAKMIRDLLRKCGYTKKGGSTLTQFLRAIPWASSTSKSGTQSAGEDSGLSMEEMERALQKALLENAQLHDAQQEGQSGTAKSSISSVATNSAG